MNEGNKKTIRALIKDIKENRKKIERLSEERKINYENDKKILEDMFDSLQTATEVKGSNYISLESKIAEFSEKYYIDRFEECNDYNQKLLRMIGYK
jgi:hypothetical protein